MRVVEREFVESYGNNTLLAEITEEKRFNINYKENFKK